MGGQRLSLLTDCCGGEANAVDTNLTHSAKPFCGFGLLRRHGSSRQAGPGVFHVITLSFGRINPSRSEPAVKIKAHRQAAMM